MKIKRSLFLFHGSMFPAEPDLVIDGSHDLATSRPVSSSILSEMDSSLAFSTIR